ncbi:nSTAND1 domain-containing NTPase [Streptomyces sp. NPDC001108]
MGRPERPIDADAGPVQRFAAELRGLRAEAGGPTYRVMAKGSGYSAPVLSQAAAGERLPTLAATLAYVAACGGDRAEWEERWREAAAQVAAAPREDEPVADSPYRGLARFEPGDAEVFFGRDALVDGLVDVVRDHRCAVVLGPSGSGKSSLLRAGLAPRLGRTTERALRPAAIRVLTPGPHPVRTHGSRLRPADGTGDTLVVVDQFEEVFTLCPDPAERAHFIDLLLAARQSGSRLRVVLGVRSDFYGRCLEHPALVRVIRDASLPVGPMGREDLRRAITGPAGVRGLTVERSLTAQLIDEVDGEPGGLPLLSHALLETWRRRSGRTLTLRSYEAAGGVRGAIAQTAEELYRTFTAPEAALTRRILLRLVAPGDGTADTCRPADRSELETAPAAGRRHGTGPADGSGDGGNTGKPGTTRNAGDAGDAGNTVDGGPADGTSTGPGTDTNTVTGTGTGTQAVLDRLARARLVTLDGDTVRLAHETLITAWPRLQGWIEEDRHRLRVLRRLTQDAADWTELGRDPGALYRGARLAEAEESFAHPAHLAQLTAAEQDFLHAARTTRTRERRRLRALAGSASLLLVLALIAGTVAWQQNRDGDRRRVDAAARRTAGTADGLRGSDPRTALRLSVAAWRLSRTPETRSALMGALGQQELPGFTPPRRSVATWTLGSDGRTLVGVDERRVTRWDIPSRRRTGSYRAPGGGDLPAGAAETAQPTPDGRFLIVPADEDGRLRLWDIRAERYQGRPFGPKGMAEPSVPDAGELVEAGPPAGEGDLSPVSVSASAAYGPSSSGHAVIFNTDADLDVWDVPTGRRLLAALPLAGTGTGTLNDSDVSPDNRLLALCTSRGLVLWDVRTRRRADTAWHRRPACPSDGRLQFTPNGRELVLLDAYALRRVSVSSGRELPKLNQVAPLDFTFTEDGTYAASRGSTDILIWRLDRPQAPVFRHQLSDEDPVDLRIDTRAGVLRYLDESPASTRTVHALDIGAVLNARWDGRPVEQAALSEDGRVLAVLRGDRLGLYDGRTGRHRSDPPPPPPSPFDQDLAPDSPTLSLSADGRRLAYVSRYEDVPGMARRVTVWDTERHRRISELRAPGEDGFMTFTLSPDGRELTTTSTAGDDTTVWSTDTARRLRTITARTAQQDGGGTQDPGMGASVDEATTGPPTANCACVAAFDRDDGLAARAELSGHISLWDTRRRTRLGMLYGGAGKGSPDAPEEITALAFSPDGTTLATAGSYGTLRLWDVPSRLALGAGLPTAGDHIRALAFAPDGRTLSLAGTHVPLQHRTIDPDRATEAVCRRAGGPLSRDQWDTYLPDTPYRRTC